MKIIEVDCCRYCPLRLPGESICRHVACEGSEIENKDIIPDWCPLEDYNSDTQK